MLLLGGLSDEGTLPSGPYLSSAATRVAATQPMLQRTVAATHVAATRKLRQRMLQATRQVAGNAGPVSATRGQLQQRQLQQRPPVAGNASGHAAFV